MFGRKSVPPAPKRTAGKKSLAQFGLMDLTNVDMDAEDDLDDLDDDNDLEAELMALTGEAPKQRKPGRPVVNQAELGQMIKDSLRDIPSDEEVSSGEDDPSLLAELQELQVESGVKSIEQPSNNVKSSSSCRSTLVERLKMYEISEQNAKAINDSSKARRMNRGISTLKDLIRRADAGAEINEDDIPSVVSTGPTKTVPAIPPRPSPSEISDSHDEPATVAPPVPPRTVKHSAPPSPDANDEPEPKMKTPSEEKPLSTETADLPANEAPVEDDNVNILKQRQNEYKKAALEAKKNNDLETALNYVKIIKQFEVMIQSAANGPIDIASIPPTPNENSFVRAASPRISENNITVQQELTITSNDVSESRPISGPASVADESYLNPTSIMDALEQRLKKYQEAEEAAKREENASKVRRMGRIIQQYKSAIQLHKAGKPLPIDELPTPPGFPPIPVDNPPKTDVHPVPAVGDVHPAPQPKRSPVPIKSSTSSANQRTLTSISRNEKQLCLLMERQKLFKAAALKAKQDGDLQLAKEYLISAKGFDPLIEASKCGLPVDLTSLPLPPNEKQALESPLNSSYEVVRLNDCVEGTDFDVFQKLKTDLQQQLELCMKTRDHFKAMGDVANANRLEQLASQTKKDLKFVQLAEKSNLRVPNFHYETKPFTIVQCNTDLTDNDVEVTVVQGINYNVPNPKAVDTYVKLYFPYPTESPQQYKTAIVYDTNNPPYNSTTTFTIQRSARACKRIFTRNALKCEIWSKNGIFRSDTLIGTVNVKLQPLETQCTLHDAFDLMDGRRTVGGKLEMKIKLRDPIVKKQVEQVEEKWLIIDT